MAFPQTAAPTVTSFTGTPTDHDCNLPATVDAGDLLILLVHITAATISAGPSGWTEQEAEALSTNGESRVYVKLADGTEDGGTARVTTSAGGNGASQCYRVTAWWGALTGVESAATSSAVANTSNPPSLTPSWGSAENLWFALSTAQDDDETYDIAPTNYGNLVSTVSGGGTDAGGECGSARRELEATNDDPGTFTLSNSERNVAYTLAVRPAAAGAVPQAMHHRRMRHAA